MASKRAYTSNRPFHCDQRRKLAQGDDGFIWPQSKPGIAYREKEPGETPGVALIAEPFSHLFSNAIMECLI